MPLQLTWLNLKKQIKNFVYPTTANLEQKDVNDKFKNAGTETNFEFAS